MYITSLDFLYIILAIGVAILAGFIAYAAFRLGQTLTMIKEILVDVKDTTSDVRMFRNQIKSAILGIVSAILKRR